MAKIIKNTPVPTSVHTKKGLDMGLQPEITEDIDKILTESKESGKAIAPHHETERETNVVDTGDRKGFFYAILKEPSTGWYKGFAKRQVMDLIANKMNVISLETDPRPTHNECGKELHGRIDLAYHGYGLGNTYTIN